MAEGGPAFVDGRGLVKAYGSTVALRGVDVAIAPGEVLGLVGGNGAGKSTLMKVLGGVTAADEGSLTIGGTAVDFAAYSPKLAMRLGLRFVHQELSLCENLRVWENFVLEYPGELRGRGWRRRAKERARKALTEVFPEHGIGAGASVESLSLGERHMVEIARAVDDPGARLVILDEPTASLPAHRAEQLGEFVKRRAATGTAFILISHRLPEVIATSSRIVVMRGGEKVLEGEAHGLRTEDLLEGMAEVSSSPAARRPTRAAAAGAEATERVRLEAATDGGPMAGPAASLRSGTIVGVTGLDGHGQRELLQQVYEAGKRGKDGVAVFGDTAYVTGDRGREGVFPLWGVAENITISSLSLVRQTGLISSESENALVAKWFGRLRIVSAEERSPIVSLSGGNQQKALIARALATDADVLVLDDPMRGVDPATKQNLYGILGEVADAGKLVLWHSTEDAELSECDEVLVLRRGSVVGHLRGEEIRPDRVLELSFGTGVEAEAESAAPEPSRLAQGLRMLPKLVPALVFVAIFAALAAVQPDTTTTFGLGLTFSVAVPLVLASLSQSFVIVGGDIDLGLGYFIGLVNVLAATYLVDEPALAALFLALLLFAYPAMAALAQARRVPAIVVTLGAGLIWSGLALTKLEAAGGTTPEWLSNAYNVATPILPEPIYICVGACLVGLFALRGTSLSVALRGLGGNADALRNAGWSVLRVRMCLYAIAGLFALVAGLAVTASTFGGDANASSDLTLLSVAAVILGGGAFSGGVVSISGTVLAALSLSLIQSLLAALSISADYTPMIQGLLLLSIVGLRYVVRER